MAMHGGNLVLLQQNYGLTVNDAQTLAPIARFEADLPKSLEQRSFEAVAMSVYTAWHATWGYGLIGVDLTDPAARVDTGNVPVKLAARSEEQRGGKKRDSTGKFRGATLIY